MLLAGGVLRLAIRAKLRQLRVTLKRNESNTSIYMLSSTDGTHGYQKSCKNSCPDHFTGMSKGHCKENFMNKRNMFLAVMFP